MPPIESRTPFSVQNPRRPVKRTSSKIIFLSLEGSVTEEEYFRVIQDIFSQIKTKIQFISVAEDAVNTIPKYRTPEQNILLSKNRPKQLAERITEFKRQKEDVYQFSKYPEDEFWIVSDVDENWGSRLIAEWNQAVEICMTNQYSYAVSNPTFEAWLLLHYCDPTEDDKAFAVTDTHEYEKTSHFRERLRELGKPLKGEKGIRPENFDAENIREAVKRAQSLHKNRDDLCPKYFATTVYLILEKILKLLTET